MHGDILDVINGMVDESGKKLAQIAEEIGKPYPTLKRELNEFDDGAKLGVMTLLPLMRSCNSVAPIQYLASRMGQRLTDMAEVCPDKPSLPEEMLDDLPSLTAYHQAMREGKPLEVVNALMQAAIGDMEQDFVAYRAEREAQGKTRPVQIRKAG